MSRDIADTLRQYLDKHQSEGREQLSQPRGAGGKGGGGLSPFDISREFVVPKELIERDTGKSVQELMLEQAYHKINGREVDFVAYDEFHDVKYSTDFETMTVAEARARVFAAPPPVVINFTPSETTAAVDPAQAFSDLLHKLNREQAESRLHRPNLNCRCIVHEVKVEVEKPKPNPRPVPNFIKKSQPSFDLRYGAAAWMAHEEDA